MANIGLPGTSNFIGEFLVIAGCLLTNTWAAFFCALGMVLGGGYSLWLLNRILFGNIKKFSIQEYQDLTRIEFYYLLLMVYLQSFLVYILNYLFLTFI
jgi:NADH-quinone oxidoreductase subunit M